MPLSSFNIISGRQLLMARTLYSGVFANGFITSADSAGGEVSAVKAQAGFWSVFMPHNWRRIFVTLVFLGM